MKFTPTRLSGLVLVELEKLEDERGFFARTWCAKEFEEHGLNPRIAQCSVSFNEKKGTLRGMHFQEAPHEEAKLLRCTRGAVFDVVIDLRADSGTFGQWLGIQLTEGDGRMLYIAEGFAHGFQTLTDATELFYQMSQSYHPESARGVRWNDPAFGIQWPFPENPILSPRDSLYPDFGLDRSP